MLDNSLFSLEGVLNWPDQTSNLNKFCTTLRNCRIKAEFPRLDHLMNFFSVRSTLLPGAFLLLLPPALAEPNLEHDVLPILTKNCMGCHGGLKKKGKLDLRTLPAMIKGGESGAAVIAGNLDESELWQQVLHDDMPEGDEKLSPKDKETLRKWIVAGLPTFADHKDSKTKPSLPAGKRHEPAQVSAGIDQHVTTRLQANQLSPSPSADDVEFLRRLYLDLAGRVPTAEEARTFLESKSDNKRAALIDQLLESPDFGKQMGRTWRDWICPPELPSDMNGGKQPHQEARRMGSWIADQVNANHSWDHIVRDLLSVRGEIKNHPQMIFYGLIGQNARATPDGSARSIGSLFMGVQIGCAQCHDDPYRDWSQNEFWSLAAFFTHTKGDFKKIEVKSGKGEIKIPDSAFLNAGSKVQVGYLRNGKTQPDREAEWRNEFIGWLTKKENPYFARSFANRAWFYFFGRGIVNPVDDIRPLNPPTHPGLLTLLENEFIASGFDLKHLVRCICNSQTYQRTSRPIGGKSVETLKPITALFGHMPLRVMTADMLYDSLKQVYGDPKLDLRAIDPKDGNQNGESAPIGDPLLQFQRDFCSNEEDPTDFRHGIPQMLTFLNHPRLMKGSKAVEDYRKKNPDLTPEQMIEWLYLSTLSRLPTPDESSTASQFVAEITEPEKAYTDVLWMLVNRSEYLFIR